MTRQELEQQVRATGQKGLILNQMYPHSSIDPNPIELGSNYGKFGCNWKAFYSKRLGRVILCQASRNFSMKFFEKA